MQGKDKISSDKTTEDSPWDCSPALETSIRELIDLKAKEIETNVTTTVLALHKQIRAENLNIRQEVRRDHSENRVRMQATHEQAAKSVAQNEIIMADQQGTRSLILDLMGEVKTLAGRIQGKREAQQDIDAQESEEAKRTDRKREMFFTVLRTLLGLGGGGAILNWIRHHWGNK